MKNRVYRVSMNLLVAFAVAAGGAMVGYGVGVVVALNGAARALHKSASERLKMSDRLPDEGIAVLTRMNASPYARCSEAELESFRRLVMESHFLKDAGRMTGGQLECSANLSRAELPDTEYSPAFHGTDNSLIYIDLKPLNLGVVTPIVMRIGDSYVSFDPYSRDSMPATTGFALTMRNVPHDQSNFLGGNRFQLSTDLLTRDVDGQVGGNLFSTQCSPRYPACLTIYVPVRTAVWEQRRKVKGWVATGALTGSVADLWGCFFTSEPRGLSSNCSGRSNAMRCGSCINHSSI